MQKETSMTPGALAVRLSPMLLVSLFSSALGVLLPQVIEHFHLSLSQAGFLVASVQSAGAISMLTGAFFIDRVGPARFLLVGISGIFFSGLLVGVIPWYFGVVFALWLLAMSTSSTAAAVNTLMALTGRRRTFYLGMMHSFYSLISIAAPLVAAYIVARATWQTYYLTVAGAAAAIATLSYWYGRSRAPERVPTPGKRDRDSKSAEAGEESSHKPGEVSGKASDEVGDVTERLSPVIPICLGVFFLAGLQAVLATWGYSYMAALHGASHTLAAAATSLFWVGILAGRLGAIPLSAIASERLLLVLGSLLSLVLVGLDWILSHPVVILGILVLIGVGVSGAFQLGTAWAAGLLPSRVGTASSLIMTSASLGGLILPSLSAVAADHYTFAALRPIMTVGFFLAFLFFYFTPRKKEEEHSEGTWRRQEVAR